VWRVFLQLAISASRSLLVFGFAQHFFKLSNLEVRLFQFLLESNVLRFLSISSLIVWMSSIDLLSKSGSLAILDCIFEITCCFCLTRLSLFNFVE
jgi:hypothetical protein